MPDFEKLYDEAIALNESGNLEAAIKTLEDLVQQSPNDALAHGTLSVYYSRQQRFDEAVEHAQRVCELEPDDPFSFIAKSLICQKAGRMGDAEEAMMSARRLQFSQSE